MTPTPDWAHVAAAKQRCSDLHDGLDNVVVPDEASGRYDDLDGLLDLLREHAKDIVRPTTTGLVHGDVAAAAPQIRPVCPVGTLAPVLVAHGGDVLPSPYEYRWSASAQPEEVGRVLDQSHSDVHIHFNGMLPFEVTFFLGLCSVEATSLDPMSPASLGLDYRAGNDLYNMWFLSALALWAISQPLAEHAELEAVLEGGGVRVPLDNPLDLWVESLLTENPRGSRHELVVEEVRHDTAEAVIASLRPPEENSSAEDLYTHICRLKEKGARLAMRGGWRAAVWMAFVAREYALFRACSLTGSGLEMFSAAFAVNRRIAPPSRQQAMELGLNALANSSHALDHVEVRPAVWMGGESAGSPDARMCFLAQDYHAMLVGYRNTLNGDRKLSMSLARSLLKRRDPVAGSEESPLDRCRAVFRSAEAYRDLIFAAPGLLEFAPGLDVAGQENLVSNLPFSAALDLVARDLQSVPAVDRQFLRFRFHAGEWFGTPVQGLRHISEAVRACRSRRPRLGHCLAMGRAENGAEVGPWVSLDDGLWLWSVCDTRPDLRADLAGPLSALVEIFFGPGVDLDELSSQRADLADLNAWIDLGLVSATREREVRHIFTGVVYPHLADTLKARYITAHGSEVEVPQESIDGLNAAAANVLPTAKAMLIEEMKNMNVVIEACPTSNIIVGDLHNIDHHPLPEIVSHGLDVTIATDDPGLLATTIRAEYELAFRSLCLAGGLKAGAEERLSAMRRIGNEVIAPPHIDEGYLGRLDHCIARLADLLAQ